MNTWTITDEGDEQLIVRNLNSEAIKQLQHIKHQAIRDFIPAFSTLGISYECLSPHTREEICQAIQNTLNHMQTSHHASSGQIIELPICYEMNLDIESIAQELHISPDAVIEKHLHSTFTVAMLGFAPGAPYMTGLHADLVPITRKSNPLLSIPAGSVGIANGQCFIYPKTSPGGWQIVGRCPLKLFNPQHDSEHLTLITPNSTVKFKRINEETFHALNELGE
ncbi:5-oxoprolinase subunit B family protein [Basilea psittacipulmonis]|uniref:5-oxoprolinase subunit B family protein n=1 Tax=Basilea psittacipulmonis TaxID=1472345 RepID=UPI000689AA1F|nr:carboxyltransferase domain-containing protein [Basilea psittacipulmonis]